MFNFTKILKITILLVIIFSLFSNFIYSGGGSSPPPPPPPCQIQSSGCYKTGDVKSNFGELIPTEFSYFLLEDKCKRTDNCDCKGVPDNIAQQNDPDASSGACSCISKTAWDPKGKCCGNSPNDCGIIVSGNLCSINSELSSWISASSPNLGDIRYVECSGAEYISDGNTWIKCDGTVWKKTINKNEYICLGKGRESIVECCGDGSCNSKVDGKKLTTGQSIRDPPVGMVISPPSVAPPSSSPPSTIAQANLVIDVQAIRSTGSESSCNTLGEGWQRFGYDSTSSITYCQKKDQSAQPPAQFINGVAAVWTGDGGGEINCGNFPGLPPVNSEIWQKIIFDTVSDITFCKHFATISQASRFVNDLRNVQPSPNHGVAGQTCSSLGPDWTEYAYNGQSDITFCGHLTTIQTPTTPTTSPLAPPSTVTPLNYVNITNYCRSDGKFVTDLDTPDSQIADTALNNNNKKTCEAAGFKWTGTKCCSEDDDNLSTSTIREFYNDAGGNGGCWNSSFVVSISFVNGTLNSTINYNGEFHGCAIDKRNFNLDNDNLLTLLDKHTNGALITNHGYCFNDPEKNYFCSYKEKWLATYGDDKTHLSSAPINNPQLASECCAQDQCWNGSSCTINQKNNPLAQPLNNKRCVDGTWASSNLKFTPDGTKSGYCPIETQCLADPFGRNQESQCIESAQYIDDSYCDNGIWSSRTKLLALELLKLKSADFTLFCDNRDNALNNLQYLTISGEIVSTVLTNLQTNNFCILKTTDKVIAATSINKNIEDIPNSLDILGITNCDQALIDDGQYHACDDANKVWFNKRLKSFIYSAASISVPGQNAQDSNLNQFNNIIDAVKRLITNPPVDQSYVKGIRKFDRLYLTQQGTKVVIGAIEGKTFKNAVIKYTGFSTDICNFANQFNQSINPVLSGISCKKDNNDYYVLVQGSKFTNLNPESIWPDLTSKLRLG